MKTLKSVTIRNLLTAFVVAAAAVCDRTEYATMVTQINASKDVPWNAEIMVGINYDNDAVLRRMAGGTIPMSSIPTTGRPRPRSLQTASGGAKPASSYPQTLNLRTKYVKCRSIAMIRNQGICASCWAVAAMTSISDRFCISQSLPGKTTERFFSFQDSLECCKNCVGSVGKPCDGGYLYQVFLFAKISGVVTGDSYGSNSLCKPYFLAPTYNGVLKNPTCANSCTITAATVFSTSGKNYVEDKRMINDFIYGRGEDQMIQALNEGGSIAATMKVYSDLYLYKSGVYIKMFGAFLGGHAVRVIGYGVADGVKYWLIANSWGSTWGEQGFFRMRRGTDECGIESNYFFAAAV